MNNIFLILFILIILCGCSESTNEPNISPSNDDVPQNKIEWGSLADTPWPMYHHDPQLTGRSEYSGPDNGLIESIKFDNCWMTMSSISIGYENTAFLPSGDFSNGIFAFDYNGNLKWEQKNNSTSTALITSDSLVIVPTVNERLIAYSHYGDTVWNSNIDKMYNLGLNIDKSGNVYFIDKLGGRDNVGNLKVINKNGELLWNFNDDRILTNPDVIPSFSPDGKTIFLQGSTVSLLAVDINSKNVKWTFGNEKLLSAPVIDNAGNIYIIPGEYGSTKFIIYSLNNEGNINWQFESKTSVLYDNIEPTIDWNGNIYFGSDTLYSFTNSGKQRWARGLEGNIISGIVCDKNNSVYFGTSDENIYSYNSDGRLNWVIRDLPFRTLGSCPAITSNGRLLFPSWRNSYLALSIIR